MNNITLEKELDYFVICLSRLPPDNLELWVKTSITLGDILSSRLYITFTYSTTRSSFTYPLCCSFNLRLTPRCRSNGLFVTMGRIRAVRDIENHCVNDFDDGMHAVEFLSALGGILTSSDSIHQVTIANMVIIYIYIYIYNIYIYNIYIYIYMNIYIILNYIYVFVIYFKVYYVLCYYIQTI